MSGQGWRFDADPRPHQSSSFSGAMKLAVMAAAELHGELVPDFLSQSAGLRKAQVMWVAGLFAAGEAGLIGHKAQVALSALLGQDEDGPL